MNGIMLFPVVGVPVVGAGDDGRGAGAVVETADPGAVLLHRASRADMLLSIVVITEFERRLRLAPSPLKLPLKFAA